MYDIYHGQNPETTASEPLLAGQIRSVLNCKMFSDLELEEFRRELATGSSVVVDSPDSSPLRLEAYTPSVGETGEHSLQSPTVHMDSGHFLDNSDIPCEDRSLFTKLYEYFTVLTKKTISERPVLPPLRFVNKKILMQTVDCVNNLCQFISMSILRTTADLLYAAAKVVTELLECHVREVLQD